MTPDEPTLDEQNGEAPAVAAAIDFLAAEPGRIDRILARHHPLPGSDICAGCSAALTRHPCAVSRLAELAGGARR